MENLIQPIILKAKEKNLSIRKPTAKDRKLISKIVKKEDYLYGWKESTLNQLLIATNDDILSMMTFKIQPDNIYLNGIETRERYSNMGLASYLIDALIMIGRKLNKKNIQLYVAEGIDNQRAIKFYERRGFKLDEDTIDAQAEDELIQLTADYFDIETFEVEDDQIDEFSSDEDITVDDLKENIIDTFYPMILYLK